MPTAPSEQPETVFRLVWHTLFEFDEPERVNPKAFQPRPSDETGLSVFRASALADPAGVLVLFAPEKRPLYAIVGVPVAQLEAMGLTVADDPIPEVPGHAVIPELTWAVYSAPGGKMVWRERLERLARLANENILREPSRPDPPGGS